MLHLTRLAGEFFARLEKIDQMIAAAVAADGCQHCDGPLHQGNYQRKPRGGLIALEGEASTMRHSLCCGREGCRRRALPPSLRFLGRRVYLETVVVLASVFTQAMASVRAAVSASGVPRRTLQRWRTWWREVFPRLPTWVELRARFVPPPPDEALMPRSLVERIEADLGARGGADEEPAAEAVMLLLGRCLAPATTGSVAQGSRFVAAASAQAAAS